MRQTRVLFDLNILGMPVGFHWSVVVLLVWALFALGSPMEGLTFFFGSVLIVSIHEIGHGIACRWRRYRVHRIVVHFLGGYCEHEATDYRLDQLAIAFGGVTFQALLVGFSLLVVSVFGMNQMPVPLKFLLMTVLVYYNLFIILLNLIPFPGFDGSSVLEGLQMRSIRRTGSRTKALSPVGRPRNLIATTERAKAPKSTITKAEAKRIADQLWAGTVRDSDKPHPER